MGTGLDRGAVSASNVMGVGRESWMDSEAETAETARKMTSVSERGLFTTNPGMINPTVDELRIWSTGGAMPPGSTVKLTLSFRIYRARSVWQVPDLQRRRKAKKGVDKFIV